MSFEIDITLQQGAFRLDARFSAPAGVTVLFGRSGSGKTTLVNAVAGLVRPQKGLIKIGERVLFDSRSGTMLPPRQRRLGYIFRCSLVRER